MSYEEKLKDPRWQKKRLEIMERDKFTCQVCERGINDGTPLNVHHLVYDKEKEPWEYASSDLITLCERCHQKVHNGEIVIPRREIATPRREIVTQRREKPNNEPHCCFYRKLFSMRDVLTGSAALVYSFLISKAFLRKDKEVTEYECLAYKPYTRPEIAKKTGMSERNVRLVMKELEVLGLIKDNFVYVTPDLCKGGFVRVPLGTKLKGWQLIFYSFLLDRSRYFGGSIDTWASRLAELTNTSQENIYVLINVLKSKGFLERDKNMRLVVK